MENAGRGCVDELIDRKARAVLIAAGTGNNGGDGFVIARVLVEQGIRVKVLLCGDQTKLAGDALVNFKRLDLGSVRVEVVPDSGAKQSVLESIQEFQPDWIVDAMLGTGAVGDPRDPFAAVIEASNQFACQKMAIDVPTGLDCDTGSNGYPTFRADLTCTFVTSKPGYAVAEAQQWLGELRVVSIGVPDEIVAQIVANCACEAKRGAGKNDEQIRSSDKPESKP